MTLVAEAYIHKWWRITTRKCVDCFLAPSRFVRDSLWSTDGMRKFDRAPHFQQGRAGRFQERSRRRSGALISGDLSLRKESTIMLRAMQRLPNLRLTIAGDGPAWGMLEKLQSSWI